LVVFPGGIDELSLGYRHTIILSRGSVFGSGINSDGQLGLGDVLPRTTPTKIPSFSDAIAISTSPGLTAHTLVLTANGAVYGFGDNSFGELGNGGFTSTTTPQMVPFLPTGIQRIAALPIRSFVSTKNGTIYGFGRHAVLKSY
jgi:alpha-tubulin suppressor-like RCC1 family protein